MTLIVGLGGVFGALVRFLFGKWFSSKVTMRFPLATWLINVSGSFILGMFAYYHVNAVMPDWMWHLLGVGFLGAYTTFSTFGYEVLQLLNKREYRSAVYYVLSSILFGISFAWFGSLLASRYI